MTAEIRQLETTPGPGRMATPQLRTVVVCDIADSTALVERMGDQNAANIIRKHDRLTRALVEQHQGHEIDKTDGFLLLFERPIQAAAFALDYQRALRHLSAAEGVVVRARVGIHMGDVVIWENAPEDVARGAKPIEVEGLVKPVAARLAQLARPQQILMSSAAAGIAHRAEGELGAEAVQHVRWRSHGKYTFKGLPDALEVVEVGEDGVAPLHAPKSVRTARRVLPWWRRPLTLAAEAAVLALGIGVGAWLLLQSPPTLAFAARDWVVVGNVHNLIGDAMFDQSVDSALRISLEQSQYVNVLPELSVRKTLRRMELNPDKTSVNRAIGSQVALRDGARALILPTVADVGGHVRVTAEVIDPNTQATVYSVSASGVGAQSVLPSLDSVTKQLRGKLGEALAMVSKESMPLDKVATGSLDALRAYSLAQRADGAGHYADAIRLYQQALAIDPHFALAHVGLARIYRDSNNLSKAIAEIDAAWADRGRLSAKDEMYVAAWRATLHDGSPAALDKWQTLAQMYPDDFTAPALHAYFRFLFGNDFDRDTLAMATRALSPHNPQSVYTHVLLGLLYLGNDRYADADREFARAKTAGLTQYLAYPLVPAAQRQFEAAAAAYTSLTSTGVLSADLDTYVPRIALAADQGDFTQVQQLVRDAQREAAKVDSPAVGEFGGIALSLATQASALATADGLRNYAKAVERELANVDAVDRPVLQIHALFAAYLAARGGDTALSGRLLDVANVPAEDSGQLRLAKLASVARAERSLAAGKPADAIATLQPQLAEGNELFLAHVVLLDAEVASHDDKAALAQARWLATHRGRAYSEWSVPIGIPFAVMHSDLALLRGAELSQALNDAGAARSGLAAFLKAWPDAANDPAVAARIKKLQTEWSPAPPPSAHQSKD
jgi:putative peptide modification system cyclase